MFLLSRQVNDAFQLDFQLLPFVIARSIFLILFCIMLEPFNRNQNLYFQHGHVALLSSMYGTISVFSKRFEMVFIALNAAVDLVLKILDSFMSFSIRR